MSLMIMGWFFGLLHPFYVSVTEVNHNSSSKSLEISVRIFTDDLENTLKMHYPNQKVDLINPPGGGAMDSLVKQYVHSRLKLQVNGSVKYMQYIGFERVSESVWCYFEITDISTVKTLKVHNPLLYEYKKEQINMIHVVNGSNRQSRKLDNPVADWEFTF